MKGHRRPAAWSCVRLALPWVLCACFIGQFQASCHYPVMARLFEVSHMYAIWPWFVILSSVACWIFSRRQHRQSGQPVFAPGWVSASCAFLLGTSVEALFLWGPTWSRTQCLVALVLFGASSVFIAIILVVHGEVWRILFNGRVAEDVRRSSPKKSAPRTSWGSLHRKRLLEGDYAMRKLTLSQKLMKKLDQEMKGLLAEFNRSVRKLAWEIRHEWPEGTWDPQERSRRMAELCIETLVVSLWASLKKIETRQDGENIREGEKFLSGQLGSSPHAQALLILIRMGAGMLEKGLEAPISGSRDLRDIWILYGKIQGEGLQDQIAKVWLALSQGFDPQTRFDLWMQFRLESHADLLFYPNPQDILSVCAWRELEGLYESWAAILPAPWRQGIEGRAAHLRAWPGMFQEPTGTPLSRPKLDPSN